MLDLFLPRTLGFKATPKGIVKEGRRFDWRSAHWTLVLAALTVAGLVKGAWELAMFGIERDADLAALRLMRFMSDFREAMWGVLQSGISELDFDFKGYAAKHFGRMELTSSDPAFVRFLER